MELSASAHLLIIVIAASCIWYSGTKLAIYSDWIAHRYNIGRAFVGAFLLALVTSSPELATTITACIINNAPLAISNLFGGINLQTFILAVADLFLVSGALTYFSPKSSLLVAGNIVILQLATVCVAFSFGELFTIWNIGFWPLLLFILYLLLLHYIKSHENDIKWIPKKSAEVKKMRLVAPTRSKLSNQSLILFFCINAFIVLVAGISIAYFADKLAIQWGWSGSWMGATLVALTTSLPELSTTFGAVRQKAYVLAVANIFGSNALTISLLFFADIFYREGSIINSAGKPDLFLVGVGVFITAFFLWGILERQNKTYLRMGIDSLCVFTAYLGSLVLLYLLK